jgi:hypothetical protein
VKLLIETIRAFPDFNHLTRAAKKDASQLSECLHLGQRVNYKQDNRSRLASTFNGLLSLGQQRCPVFIPEDFPGYFDGSQDIPFGQFGARPITYKTYQEVESWEGPQSLLS